jgi:hypothetical protein
MMRKVEPGQQGQVDTQGREHAGKVGTGQHVMVYAPGGKAGVDDYACGHLESYAVILNFWLTNARVGLAQCHQQQQGSTCACL